MEITTEPIYHPFAVGQLLPEIRMTLGPVDVQKTETDRAEKIVLVFAVDDEEELAMLRDIFSDHDIEIEVR